MRMDGARLLALDLTYHGFGFAVLEIPLRLVDWGFARVWSTSDNEFLARVETMFIRYKPDAVCLEQIDDAQHRQRAHRRTAAIASYAESLRQPAFCVPRATVRKVFGDVRTKYEVAEQIAETFPELRSRLPTKPRKRWENEDERMHVFDALSWALTVLAAREVAILGAA